VCVAKKTSCRSRCSWFWKEVPICEKGINTTKSTRFYEIIKPWWTDIRVCNLPHKSSQNTTRRNPGKSVALRLQSRPKAQRRSPSNSTVGFNNWNMHQWALRCHYHIALPLCIVLCIVLCRVLCRSTSVLGRERQRCFVWSFMRAAQGHVCMREASTSVCSTTIIHECRYASYLLEDGHY